MKRIWPALLLAAVVFAEPPKKKPAAGPPLGELEQQVLDRVNHYRKIAGVPAAACDAKLSAGCLAHAKYLLANFDHHMSKGLSMHSEVEGREGFSKDGAEAGKASNIHYVEPVESVDGLMATLFHRIPLLNPELAKVGIGLAQGKSNPPWVVCVDVMRGLPPLDAGPVRATLYPAENQKDVPLEFGGERPTPIPDDKDGKAGFPVTATFREDNTVADVTATLKDGAGKEVPVWLSTPEKPANPDGQRNSVALIPQDPLQPGATYTVTIAAKANGKAWTKSWKFTTRK